MNFIRKNLSLSLIGIGVLVCIGALLIDHYMLSKYLVAVGALLATAGLLKFMINVNRALNRFAKSFKKLDSFNVQEKNLQGRSRFEVSSMLKKLVGDYDLIREHQKSVALTSAIDFRTRALFASMKNNETQDQERTNNDLGSIIRGIEELERVNALLDSRTRKIFAQTSGLQSFYEGHPEAPAFAQLREQMVTSNRKVTTSFGTAFYGISNRLHEVERNLAEVLKIGQISSISQWQINHRTLLGGLELMRTAASLHNYLRSSEGILEAVKRVKVAPDSDFVCGSLSEFSLFYATEVRAASTGTALVLCKNVLEQEFLLGIIENLPKNIQIIPIMLEEIQDILKQDNENLILINKLLSLDSNDVIDVSSSVVETLRT